MSAVFVNTEHGGCREAGGHTGDEALVGLAEAVELGGLIHEYSQVA